MGVYFRLRHLALGKVLHIKTKPTSGQKSWQGLFSADLDCLSERLAVRVDLDMYRNHHRHTRRLKT